MSPSCASTDKGVVRGWITTMMTLLQTWVWYADGLLVWWHLTLLMTLRTADNGLSCSDDFIDGSTFFLLFIAPYLLLKRLKIQRRRTQCGHGGYDAFLFYAMSKYALDRQRYGRSIVMTTICVVGLVIHTGQVSRREWTTNTTTLPTAGAFFISSSWDIAFNNNNNKYSHNHMYHISKK